MGATPPATPTRRCALRHPGSSSTFFGGGVDQRGGLSRLSPPPRWSPPRRKKPWGGAGKAWKGSRAGAFKRSSASFSPFHHFFSAGGPRPARGGHACHPLLAGHHPLPKKPRGGGRGKPGKEAEQARLSAALLLFPLSAAFFGGGGDQRGGGHPSPPPRWSPPPPRRKKASERGKSPLSVYTCVVTS